jgi:hypothetical protein
LPEEYGPWEALLLNIFPKQLLNWKKQGKEPGAQSFPNIDAVLKAQALSSGLRLKGFADPQNKQKLFVKNPVMLRK